jgi:hypothetical protein
MFVLDGTRTDAKVEVPQDEPGSDRQTFPIKVVLQDGDCPLSSVKTRICL